MLQFVGDKSYKVFEITGRFSMTADDKLRMLLLKDLKKNYPYCMFTEGQYPTI